MYKAKKCPLLLNKTLAENIYDNTLMVTVGPHSQVVSNLGCQKLMLWVSSWPEWLTQSVGMRLNVVRRHHE